MLIFQDAYPHLRLILLYWNIVNTISFLFFSHLLSYSWHYHPAEEKYFPLLLLPLIISFLLTIVFYEKSIKLLREQSEHEVLSTRIYVRTLRLYSVVQLLTYGPLILSLLIPSDQAKNIFVGFYEVLWNALESIANLSGLFTALIFASQFTATSHQPILDQIDNDLTQDLA